MTRRRRFAAVAAMLAAFFLPGPAQAPPVCGATEALLATLAERYGERPAGLGVTTVGQLLQLLVRPDQRSWTVLLTRPDGVSCLLAAGHDWQRRMETPGANL